jgi:hypothetical protein
VLLGALSPTDTPALAGTLKSACRGARVKPDAHNGANVARATICLINLERARHRLAALRANPALTRIALGQSADMVRGNYFADHSLGGRTPLERIAPALRPAHVATTGQNIGWGSGADATPEAIVRAWMNSPPHRRIMLAAAFREAGVGVAPSLPAVLEQGTRGATYTLDLTAFSNGGPAPGASTSASHTSAPHTSAPLTSTPTAPRPAGAGAGGERPTVSASSSTAQELAAG